MAHVVRADMTIEQADAVTAGLDLSSRIMMGQIGEIAMLARTERLFVRDDRSPEGFRAPSPDEIDRIEDLADAISAILGHPRGSFGIGARGVPIEGKRQYEVQKAIQKVLADQRNPGGGTVHHDGLSVRYTRDPEPTATLAANA